MDTKFTPPGLRPTRVAMTPFHVIVADDRVVYVWQYRTQVSKLTTMDGAGGGGGAGGAGEGTAQSMHSGVFGSNPT